MTEFEQRLSAAQQLLQAEGLDGMLVTHPTNRRYLTGFTADDIPPDESAGYLLFTRADAVLVTGSVNVTQAQAQAPHTKVVKRKKSWANSVTKLIQEHRIHRLGYEPNALLEGVFRQINEQLNEEGYRLAWFDQSSAIPEMRATKSDAELALLRKAFEITVASFAAVEPTIRAGDTERDVAWRIHSEMVARGAEGPAFPIIVAAGTNAARPHHEPGETIIVEGEPIVIDMGARYEGYCADLTRTVWVGDPDQRLKEVYSVVNGAVEAVLERAHPGLSGGELDRIARDYIEQQGYGEAFTHGLGHGVGLRVHESPSAGRNVEMTLEPGHTLTIEPGIYLPEWGGVRIEDVIVFTEDGYEILTSDAEKRRIDEDDDERKGS
ncbi:MAG: M24 family metallopeptidase [Chloroflexota bacterium]